jgi:acyl-coenzyme A synthetase/AMP-(fatty) acid ligase
MDKRSFDPHQATRTLQDYVKRKLLPHKYPRIIQFLPELPKTGTGKIDRQALHEMGAGDLTSNQAAASTARVRSGRFALRGKRDEVKSPALALGRD